MSRCRGKQKSAGHAPTAPNSVSRASFSPSQQSGYHKKSQTISQGFAYVLVCLRALVCPIACTQPVFSS